MWFGALIFSCVACAVQSRRISDFNLRLDEQLLPDAALRKSESLATLLLALSDPRPFRLESASARPSRLAPQMVASGTRGTMRARLVGIGSAQPATKVSNTQLEKLVETSDEWIQKRTGIASRSLLTPSEGLAGLASKAATNALEHAGVSADEVDLVIVATSSADDMFGDAAFVASQIGATNAVGFDLTAACSGFLFGVSTASQFLHSGAYKTVVVIGADALSRWVDWKDRNTCVLFGDGAGAVVMKAAETDAEAGVLGFEMHSDGSGRQNLNLAYSGKEEDLAGITSVTNGAYGCIDMNGKEVYKFATSRVPEVLKEALDTAGVKAEEVDWLVLHQANIRIMETVAKKLGIPMEKVITNLDETGNTSAGSIPLALDAAVKSGKVKKGDLIAMSGFGAGLSWGASVIRWG